MKDTRAVLVKLQQTLDPDSPLAVHLNQTLNQLSETGRSLEEFTDYLQRNPGALVRGKYVPDKER
jgi:paraquat-inducible protein B